MADSTEVPLRPAGEQAGAKPAKQPKQPKQPKEAKQGKQGGKQQQQPGAGQAGKKADANLNGITVSKDINFSEWYQEIVTKGELVEYYTEISGFYILRPASMHIWNVIRDWFTDKTRKMGVKETSFPMFLSKTSLDKEKDHVEGFAPELAWVTKAGEKDLEVPVAVRPTSEAVMYPYYAKWIRSHRDLPLRLQQWNSVVRWEAKQTTPFLRAREFLWQEGHTAHVSEKNAEEEVLEILEHYAGVYEQLLAVPVVRGKKTEAEKFAGGYWTSTCEGFIPSTGRGIQGATSHALGQNFSKMFNIIVEDPAKKGEHLHVWQNSWGLSTRVIGVMVMIHGDDKGLVLPPRIAPIHAVVIPVGLTAKTTAEVREALLKQTEELAASLKAANILTELDDRDGYTPGFKFAEWEMKGVPLRLEFGPKDMEKSVVSYARRDTGEKGTIPVAELATQVPVLLEQIQKDMYDKAEANFAAHRLIINDWEKVVPALNSKNLVIIPFCEEIACEDRMKEITKSEGEQRELGPDGKPQPTMGMKSLCIPFDQPEGLVKGETKCLNPECGRDAKSWVMFGRSY
ncbi:prolyl-tRNA synthetase [Coniochaeta ligniaria NRRL 30616]|uniref:proline--tRNA ligase n=1 Tax=Coniochaeta ligniaria NRRL 30616 TaxID=1408157 RepID=A0A1J7JW34_9PEZI|nr:prolyl-tRNA synthetase [Coniochaeta ligniaria NRRL 30616]